jgi:hypothetical protein
VPERLTRHAIAAACRKQVLSLALEQNLDPRTLDELLYPVLSFVAERNQRSAPRRPPARPLPVRPTP